MTERPTDYVDFREDAYWLVEFTYNAGRAREAMLYVKNQTHCMDKFQI